MIKKIFFFFLVSLMLTSCGSKPLTITGELSELGGSFFMYGSHTLTTESGDFYALTSEVLDLYNYEEMSVIIVGQKVPGYPVDGGPEYIEVLQIKELHE